MKLIEEFSNLEKNKFNLEIYGKIDDINYYNELLNFINNNNLSNIKLFDFTEKYTERLKEAEYFCLYSINETSNYSILEAISLNKKIICSEECIVSDIIKYYPNKNKNFDLIFNLQNYTSPKNIFTQQYLNLILYENINIKKYIGLEIINEDTLDKIVENEISNQIILKPGLSFLLRIKNEEYYILNNIYGIYDVADEIIICDNNSTDDTVNIMKYFNKYYTKIFVYNYNITINNIRSNNNNNYKKQISTFYNWCLSKATRYNVIKWDGDFESIQINLKNMITKYNSHFRNDNFAIWFGGLTKFYNYYINISSYYDEYRCFSKLNGFKWHDTNICETSDFYIKNCPTKYINGYDDIINKIWLGNDAKKFDIKRKPIFIENKNFKDFKEYVIDTRCLNDNKILINFKNNIINHKIKKEIIFLTILNTDNIGGIESFNSILYDLFINFIDVKFIVINNDCTLIDNTNNYFSLEYFRKNMNIFNSYNLKIITSFEIFNLYELKTIKNNFENINLYGITHSEVSYYNKYFSENSDYFEKIITINKQTYNKYKKINIKNVILLHNNINEINKISNIYTFNKENIKILFFSRSSYDKNVIMLLYAINKIIDKGYKVIIDLYTDNNNTINFYHNLLKNKSSINFKKFTNNKDIYLDYDFCILPSVSEGCSMNILESINYQIPILCTMIQSNNEIINNYLPMFNFNNLDNISNLFIYNYNDFLEIIGYETSFNNTQLGILTPYITNNKNKIMIFENNLNEIVNKIEELINNYDFYKNKTIELKNFIRNKYFNIKKYIQEINNLILYNHNIIDYEVE